MLEKKPFTRYRFDEEVKKDKRKVVPVSINKDEQKIIDDLKDIMNIDNDSTALKYGATIALNVLHGTFGVEILKALIRKNK